MEGKFYRRKLPTHPHTNMAKAALNMMTRTSAAEYSKDGIFMTAVDTGWINDENPLDTAVRIKEEHNFATPLDEVDAAARILDPIFAPLIEGQRQKNDSGSSGGSAEGLCSPPFGSFLKDFFVTEW
jgi:NAD(P)-dependent dehydrogenase (short-subunit alcohol dehydrogenase family)